ncbi:MAG: hypothetical protein ABR548_00105 [Actinomycetota bacterium]|nr:hypothetical protein [Actinomycetota bacterium]
MSLRKQVAEIVTNHIDEIVDETTAEYIRQIPSCATASAEQLKMIRAATKRATLAFVQMYADPSSPSRPFVQAARAATVERAGENFERTDIAEMIDIGRRTIYAVARKLVAQELTLTEEQRAQIQSALGGFLTEMERADEVDMHVTPDVLMQWLNRAETEEPDIR